jgi:hypothetical protein
MKCILIALAIGASSPTTGHIYPDGWQFVPLPPEDEYATNRFGHSWSDPVYNGYVIVSNRYIEAPYVVEQRGFVIFVNGERLEDGTDIRLVSPVPVPPPVTVDPGEITGLSKSSSLFEMFSNPTYRAKQEYWNDKGFYGQARFQADMDLLRSFPCVSNVVDLKTKDFCGSEVQIYDNQGNSMLVSLTTAPRKPMRTATDPEMYGHITRTLGGRAGDLNRGTIFRVINGTQPGGSGRVEEDWQTNLWTVVFKALADDSASQSQKVVRLRETGMFRQDEDFELVRMLPMSNFVATAQLWQRLSGDTSWTNDAPARLLALTNGWQRIPPAFMRTQTVASASVGTTNTPAVRNPTASTATQTVTASATRTETREKDADRVWPVIAMAGGLAALLFLLRRRPLRS